MTQAVISEKGHPERVRRTIQTHDGWTLTQIAQPNGEWWNIKIERTPIEELGHKGRSWRGR